MWFEGESSKDKILGIRSISGHTARECADQTSGTCKESDKNETTNVCQGSSPFCIEPIQIWIIASKNDNSPKALVSAFLCGGCYDKPT